MSRKKMVDAIDIQILNILQKDGRITNKELANRIGLSESPTITRVQNLIKRKVIRSVNACVDFERFKLSFRTLMMIHVRKSHLDRLTQWLHDSGKSIQVFEVYRRSYLEDDLTWVYAIVASRTRLAYREYQKELYLSMSGNVLIIESVSIKATFSEVPVINLTNENLL